MKSKYFIIGLTLSLVVGLIIYAVLQPQPGTSVEDLGNEHIETVESSRIAYNSLPPTSGPHVGYTAPWGVSDLQIADEILVHNLEDGGVIVHYRPDTSEEDIEQLRSIVSQYSTQVILQPYESLDAPIALTAWNQIDKLETLDEQRIKQFINSYKGIDHHK